MSAGSGSIIPVSDEVQSALGYLFRQQTLLDEALTHKSYIQGTKDGDQRHNERLEFLGDAVLGLVVSQYVALAHPTCREGELSKIKARVVSRHSLARAARRLTLGRWLKLGRGEERTKGREKSSLLANALEAVIAAIYLDGGLEAARSVIVRILKEELEGEDGSSADAMGWDYKSRLQEWSHKHYETVPQYRIIHESGPDHQKFFEVEVLLNGMVYGRGSGRTKKEAEQMSAKQVLEIESRKKEQV